jgi:hypothetical protein
MKWQLIFILALGLAFAPTQYAQHTRLTQTQVLHLIEVHAPDELVASQVRLRGLSFSVTSKLIDSFTASGAGPHTLAELREQVRTGTVEVHTEPGARVSLDGRAVGVANQAGVLIVSDVTPGGHNVAAGKDSFRDGQNALVLGNREYKRISIPLQWTGGFLTLSVVPPDAAIAVTGPQSFTGATTNAKCLAGTYTVTASADGYSPLKREFLVGAGEHHVEQVHLSADPALMSRLEDEIRKDLASGKTRDALQMAHKAVALSPSDSTASLLLSIAYFTTYMGSAVDSEHSGNWNGAIVNYHRAAQAMPKMGEPWLEIGYIDLQQGRFEEAKQSFTKSADLGFPVALHCVEHKLLSNKGGTISIGSHELKFMSNGKEIYHVPVSQVVIARIGLAAFAGPNAYYFDLSFEGKKHRFEFLPSNAQCSFFNGDNLICSGNGLDQQHAVAEWVQDAIGKYASGTPTNQ